MTKTFYDLLGVSQSASTSEIETAYREEIKQVHPDVSDDVDAGERTKRLNEAKRVLTDDAERQRYDRIGHEAYTGDGRSDSNGDSATRSGGTSSDSSAGGRGTDASASSRARRNGRRARQNSRRHATDSGRNTGSAHRQNTSNSGRENGESGRYQRAGARGTANESQESGGAGREGVGTSRERTGKADWDPGANSTGPSRASSGPTWQSGRTGSAGPAGESPSANRQAAAGQTDGPNVDWSWNSWEQTRSWAVRQGSGGQQGFHPRDIFDVEHSVVLLASTFLLYPFFIASIVFPAFPLVARVTVGVCTLLMFAYLLSVPEIAVVVYGLWSVLFPVGLIVLPGVSLFSFAGVIGISATWIPFALSFLALSVLRN